MIHIRLASPGRRTLPLFVLASVLIAGVTRGQAPIEVYLQPWKNVGVGFGDLPATTTEVAVRLLSTNDYKIVLRAAPGPESSRVEEKTGSILWHRKGDHELQHFWEGVGVIRTYGMAVRFYAELHKGAPAGGGTAAIASRGSVADISIDMDTKGAHEGPNWPPEGCRVEDEMKIVPGMRLPPSLVTGQFPLQVPQGAEYKLMDFSLRTAWGGHFDGSTPSAYGKVELQISGPGVAVYDSSGVFWGKHDTSEETRTKTVSLAKYEKIPFRVLTNEGFDGERTIKVVFRWDQDLAGGPEGEPEEDADEPKDDAIAEIRLVPYETTRRILGPKHVPGLSKYRYRLELAPGETLDPETSVNWNVTTEDSDDHLAHMSGQEGLEVNVEYKNTSPAWITLKATFQMDNQALSAEETIALVQVEVGAPTFTSDNTMDSVSVLDYTGGSPPFGLGPTFVMKHEPGYDWLAFKTNLIPFGATDQTKVFSGAGGNPAMSVNTPITFRAPVPEQGKPPAHHYIEVGYTQMASIDGRGTQRSYGYYLTKSGHGYRRNTFPDGVVHPNHDSLDWVHCRARIPVNMPTRWPWYRHTVGHGDDATLGPVDVELHDSPANGFPERFGGWGMQDPNRDAPLDAMRCFYFFKVRLAARTTDTELNAHTKVFALTDEREWRIELCYDPFGAHGEVTGPEEQGPWESPVAPDDLGAEGAGKTVHCVVATIAGQDYYQQESELVPAEK